MDQKDPGEGGGEAETCVVLSVQSYLFLSFFLLVFAFLPTSTCSETKEKKKYTIIRILLFISSPLSAHPLANFLNYALSFSLFQRIGKDYL